MKRCLFAGLLLAAQWVHADSRPFHVGEKFRFDIYWGIVKAGYSTLEVAETIQVSSRPAYHIVSEAYSTGFVNSFYKVRDRNESWLDQEHLFSYRALKRLREGGFKRDEDVTFNYRDKSFLERRPKPGSDQVEEKTGPLPGPVLDVFTSFYYFRTRDLEVGKEYSIDVYGDFKTYPLIVRVLAKEKVKVPAGEFECFKLEPTLRSSGIFISKGKNMQIWLSADERKMPVLMRAEVFIGHVEARLAEYSRP